MRRLVSGLPQEMEQVQGRSWGVARPADVAQDAGEGGVDLRQQAGSGADVLGHQFGELAQFEDAGVGVGPEVVLAQRRQPVQLGVAGLQKLKVGALRLTPGRHGRH